MLGHTSSSSVRCSYIHAMAEASSALPSTACWYRGAVSTRIQPTFSVRLLSVLSHGLLQPSTPPKSDPSFAFLQLAEDLGSHICKNYCCADPLELPLLSGPVAQAGRPWFGHFVLFNLPGNYFLSKILSGAALLLARKGKWEYFRNRKWGRQTDSRGRAGLLLWYVLPFESQVFI